LKLKISKDGVKVLAHEIVQGLPVPVLATHHKGKPPLVARAKIQHWHRAPKLESYKPIEESNPAPDPVSSSEEAAPSFLRHFPIDLRQLIAVLVILKYIQYLQYKPRETE